jgi:hypothetical protein
MMMAYFTSLSSFPLRSFYFDMHFLTPEPYKSPRKRGELEQWPTPPRDRVPQFLFTRRDDAVLLTRCYSGRPHSKGLCCHRPRCYPPDRQQGHSPRWLSSLVGDLLLVLLSRAEDNFYIISSASLAGGTFPGPLIRATKVVQLLECSCSLF